MPTRKTLRRTPAKRSRSSSRLPPAKPLLTPTQLREAVGVLIVGFGLILGIAMLSGDGSLLSALRQFIERAFGFSWPLSVVSVLALGGVMAWPHQPPPRLIAVLAAGVAILSIDGLISLASPGAGGSVGSAVSNPAISLLGHLGAAVVLVVVLVLGAIVAFRFSPATILLHAVQAMQAAAIAEREELSPLQPHSLRREELPAEAIPELAAPVKAEPEWPMLVDNSLATEEEPFTPHLPSPAGGEESMEEVKPGSFVTFEEGREVEAWAGIEWRLPPVTLLDTITVKRERIEDEIKRNVQVIQSTLQTFGVQARVIGVNSGPAVTQYQLQPAAGVAVKRIVSLQNDLALALAASPLRIEAPIPGKSAVGIEVPNKSATPVSLREGVESPAFRNGGQALAVALGNDVTGQPITGDLSRMPHLLIAGATGQGKSVCINALLCSLLMHSNPTELRLVMIDPKRVELNLYNDLPHLAVPVIVEPHHAAAALRWAVGEMDRRYRLLSAEGVRNIRGYNDKAVQQRAIPLPYVVVVIDELADLMMVAAGEVEELICRIAQLARAVGIHLVIATQRPSTDIITGLIKANVPSRIAFAVGSQVDSRVILDSVGAEKLLGRGDMLYQPIDSGRPTRIKGAFVHEREVEGLVKFWKDQAPPSYMGEILSSAVNPDQTEEGGRKLDPLFARSARAICAEGTASVSLIQRKFNVGYSRAGRIVDQLAEHRVIGAYQGSKSREILMTLPDVDELLERLGLEE